MSYGEIPLYADSPVNSPSMATKEASSMADRTAGSARAKFSEVTSMAADRGVGGGFFDNGAILAASLERNPPTLADSARLTEGIQLNCPVRLVRVSSGRGADPSPPHSGKTLRGRGQIHPVEAGGIDIYRAV